MTAIAYAQPFGLSRPVRNRAAVYRRRRAVAAAVVVGALVAPWAGLRALGVPASAPPRPSGTVVHVVQPGDTIWSIARQLQPSGDVRPLVDRVVAARGGALLQVGERIVVPIDP